MVELCKKYLRPQEDRIKKVQDISVLEFSSASVETGRYQGQVDDLFREKYLA